MQEFIKKLIERLKIKEEELERISSECALSELKKERNYGYHIAISHAIEIINELAEEYNNVWINADVESPTENGKYIVYYRKWTDGNYLPKFDETEIRILRYRNNDWVFPTYGDTEAEKDIHREVLAWQPLPAPYQPKGE